MKRGFIGIAAMLFCVQIWAQQQDVRNVPWIESNKLLEEAAALQQEEKYSDAIQKLLIVPSNDSNYSNVLQSLAYLAYLRKSYDSSIRFCEEGLKRNDHNFSAFSLLRATALDDAGKKEESLKAYDDFIKRAPVLWTGYFEKAVALANGRQIPEAISQYQTSIALSPFSASPHYHLGRLCALNDKPTQAVMSLSLYLLLEPNTSRSIEALKLMESIFKQTMTFHKDSIVKFNGEGNRFESYDEMIRAKVAYGTGYKLRTKIDFNLLNGLQLLIEKFQYRTDDKGFWMQTYGPLFKYLKEKDHFEAFAAKLLSSQDNETVQKVLKKKDKEIGEMNAGLGEIIRQWRKTSPRAYLPAYKDLEFWYDDNGLEAAGKGTIADQTLKRTGVWYYFYSNGILQATGEYDNEGQKTGEWKYYYDNGALKELSSNKAGVLDGAYKTFYKNGALSEKGNYVEGKLQGEVSACHPNGLPKRIFTFKDGEYDGPRTDYYMWGEKEVETSYKSGAFDGPTKLYYNTGELSKEYVVVNNKVEGLYKEYYSNGKLKLECMQKGGENEGEHKRYHENGQLEQVSNYVGGKLHGILLNYSDNGKKEGEYSYVNGHLELAKYFDTSGFLLGERKFKEDKVIAYKYWDKNGKILSQGDDRKGNMPLKAYRGDGTLWYEGTIRNGKWFGMRTYYLSNGRKDYELQYDENENVVHKKDYFLNGRLFEELNYKEEQLDGYYRRWYKNGQLYREGYYEGGEMEGIWITYHPNGKVSNKKYYVHDIETGSQTEYRMNGTLKKEMTYWNGVLESRRLYDTTGKMYQETNLEHGSGMVLEKHPNGKMALQVAYKNGYPDGPLKRFYPNGQPAEEALYKMGFAVGTCKVYGFNGKLTSNSNYKNSKYEGEYRDFHENGQPEMVCTYRMGDCEGKRIFYYTNGKVETEGLYKGNVRHGEFNYYAPDGTLRVRIVYQDGRIKSYTYLGKDGKLLPLIPVHGNEFVITAYYPNGNKSYEAGYLYNWRHGVFNTYYTDGKPAFLSNWVDDEKVGQSKSYFANGKLEFDENYRDGYLHGSSVYYSENGAMLKQMSYIFGEKHGRATVQADQGKKRSD